MMGFAIGQILKGMCESGLIAWQSLFYHHPINREFYRLKLLGVISRKSDAKTLEAQRLAYYQSRQLSQEEMAKVIRDRNRGRKLNLLWMIGWGLVVMLLSAKAVFAITNPDTLLIDSVRGYSGVLDTTGTGDLLVVVEYDIDYSILPAEPANETFVCRFMRGTEELNASEIYPFNDKGYGRGVCSFYWTVLEKTSDSIEFGDPNGEAYNVCVQGKPTAFPDPPKVCSTTIVWRDATKTESLLETDILNIATSLENDADWAPFDLVTSVSGTIVLTGDGEEYFLGSIPNLNAMAPDIFASSTTQPFVEERSHPKTYSNSLQNFWANTPVDTWLTSTSDFLRMQKIVISSLIALFIMAVIVWVVTIKSNGTFELGLLAAAITLPLFVRVGWVSLSIGALVGFLAIIAIGWAFFLRRAG